MHPHVLTFLSSAATAGQSPRESKSCRACGPAPGLVAKSLDRAWQMVHSGGTAEVGSCCCAVTCAIAFMNRLATLVLLSCAAAGSPSLSRRAAVRPAARCSTSSVVCRR